VTELKAPQRKKKAAADRDPVLWVVMLLSIAVIAVLGYAKYQSDRRNQPATPQMALDPRLPNMGNGGAAGNRDADPGMEAGSFTTLEPVQEDFAIKAAPKPRASDQLSSDCKGLLEEQQMIEARMRRPYGQAQGEQFLARLEELSTAAQRKGC
jgi:hypothetical protein